MQKLMQIKEQMAVQRAAAAENRRGAVNNVKKESKQLKQASQVHAIVSKRQRLTQHIYALTAPSCSCCSFSFSFLQLLLDHSSTSVTMYNVQCNVQMNTHVQ